MGKYQSLYTQWEKYLEKHFKRFGQFYTNLNRMEDARKKTNIVWLFSRK